MDIYTKVQKDKLTDIENRPLLSLIMSEICIDGKPMTDTEAIKILVQLRKNSLRTIEEIEKRSPFEGDVVAFDMEEGFISLLNRYLPKGATAEDVEVMLAELNLPRTMKSMGKLMGALKKKFEVVDGNMVRGLLN